MAKCSDLYGEEGFYTPILREISPILREDIKVLICEIWTGIDPNPIRQPAILNAVPSPVAVLAIHNSLISIIFPYALLSADLILHPNKPRMDIDIPIIQL